MANSVYRTMQGKEIDMEQLMARNETMPAVGNVRVNARGDELGPDGKIIKTRESVLAEYYDNDPRTVSDEEISLTQVKINSPKKPEVVEQPQNKNKVKDTK
jgi:rRNA maturation endonuclease Nob1